MTEILGIFRYLYSKDEMTIVMIEGWRKMLITIDNLFISTAHFPFFTF